MSIWNEEDYTTEHLLGMCAVDNGWASDELGERIKKMRNALMRCSTLCNHLSVERRGWKRLIFGRWLIADEPLRGDAKQLLRIIGDILTP